MSNHKEILYVRAPQQKQASDFLTEGAAILTQRGQQYGSEGRECSFPEAAAAFNAITGHSLKGSDVCLILALVKQVRQYSQPDRFHEDSAVDGINYLALQAEQLKKERGIMSEEKFTKGPWQSFGMEIRFPDRFTGEYITPVASVSRVNLCMHDAALISAAPEMFEILRVILEDYVLSAEDEAEIMRVVCKARGEL